MTKILENDVKQLTELLPKLQDAAVAPSVDLIINEAQDLIKDMPTLANGGTAEAKAYLESTLKEALIAYIDGSIVEITKPGDCQHQTHSFAS